LNEVKPNVFAKGPLESSCFAKLPPTDLAAFSLQSEPDPPFLHPRVHRSACRSGRAGARISSVE